MNVLILGGMSQRHYAWIREVAEVLRPHFAQVRLLDYAHWASDTEMDVEHEITEAVKLAEDFGEYIVVAKSIGTVVATLANARGLLHPDYCVFLGFPLKVVVTELPEVADSLPKLPPVHFVHNEHDPLGDADAVKAYLEAHAPESYDLLVSPGDAHDYVNFDLILDLAKG